MGRGDNRRSQKMRRRSAWRKLKLRLSRKIEGAAAKPAASTKK